MVSFLSVFPLLSYADAASCEFFDLLVVVLRDLFPRESRPNINMVTIPHFCRATRMLSRGYLHETGSLVWLCHLLSDPFTFGAEPFLRAGARFRPLYLSYLG